MTILQFIKELAQKAKIDLNKPEYAAVLTVTGELPDEVGSGIINSLMDEEVAKNNPTLSKYFNARALNGIDAQVMLAADEEGLTDADKTELIAEKSSSKKITLLQKKIKDSLVAKHTATGDNKGLKEEITKLNNDMLGLRTTQTAELAKVKADSDNAVLEFALDSTLATVPYANKDIPATTNAQLLKILANNALREKKAKIVRDGTTLKLVNAENPDLDYLENNKPVALNEFINAVAANNKLIQVNGPTTTVTKPIVTKTPLAGHQTPANPSTNKIVEQLKQDAAAFVS